MGLPRKRNRVDATGRVATSRFVRLDYCILNSNAYRALSPNARALLVELAMLYNGSNNGSLYLSVRDAAYRMGLADLTAATQAFSDLQELGFIEQTQEAYFSVKAADKSRARCWRLTWLAGPGRKGPTMTFQSCEPLPQTQARKRMERGQRVLKAYRKARDSGHLPVLDFETMVPNQANAPTIPVLVSNTPMSRNGGFLPKFHVPDSATYLATTMGREMSWAPLGWWQCDWSPTIARLAYLGLIASNLPLHGTKHRMAA
jgi:hypothetical protein